MLARTAHSMRPGDIHLQPPRCSAALEQRGVFAVFVRRLVAFACAGALDRRRRMGCARDSTEIAQEGLQFHSIRLCSSGEPCRDIYSIIESNTRLPRMLAGDIQAQLSGCLLGREMIEQLITKYSAPAFRAAVELMWDRSEAAARAAIRRIPDGRDEAQSLLDNDGLDLERRLPLDIAVIVAGDEMTVDLSGVAKQVRGSINSGREGGAVRWRIARFLVARRIQQRGSFRPLASKCQRARSVRAAGAAMGLYSPPLQA
jgi:N-methylhydantoinase B